jgi:hypothetical protein
MSLFKPENFGKPLNVELSNYLNSYIGKNEYANVSEKTGVSISTIKFVVLRVNTLTENNSVAIIELMKIAVEKCNTSMQNAKEAKKFLEKNLLIEA